MAKPRRPKLKHQPTTAHAGASSSAQLPQWTWKVGGLVVMGIGIGLLTWMNLPQTPPDRPTQTTRADSLATLSKGELEDVLRIPGSPQTQGDEAVDTEAWSAALDQALQRLNEKLPADPQARHLLGLIHLRLKRTQQAEPALRQAVSLAPADPEMRLDLADLLTQTGRDEEALEVLQALSDQSLPASYLNKLGDCQLRLGQLEVAIKTFNKALESEPNDAQLWLNLAKAQLQSENYTDCEASVRNALQSDKENVEAWNVLGQVLTLLKRQEDAHAARARAQELKGPSSTQLPFEVAHAQSMVKVYGSAFRSLALLYQDKGDTAQANQMFATAMQVDPTDWVALGKWAALMRRLGEYDQAAEFHRRLVRAQPHEPAHYQNLANICMELGKPRHAEAALRLACLEMPGNGQSHLLLARFLLLVNKFDEATVPAQVAAELLKNQESAEVLQRASGRQP